MHLVTVFCIYYLLFRSQIAHKRTYAIQGDLDARKAFLFS
jgi:hypothetical protein